MALSLRPQKKKIAGSRSHISAGLYCNVLLRKFGIEKESLTFTEFVELISRELIRQNLNKSVELAEKYGLSPMTMDQITEEVKAVR